ncbi:MAG: hypothetical protein V4550_08765 [Gemmatimonadota bacterium]
MLDPARNAARDAPDLVNRRTRRGEDQHVLACNVRRTAGDIAFRHIEQIEQQNRELRSELAWQKQNRPTRRLRWLRSRLTVTVCLLAVVGLLVGAVFSPSGKRARVGLLVGYYDDRGIPPVTWQGKHLLTSDMPRREVDSLAAYFREFAGGFHR